MPELFISYSRKDKEFVQRLHAGLAAQKRDVWVDWEDIPLASDWRAEVFAGIESSDSFVFVLSPNSAASEVCAEEVNHAVSCQKRVIPILYEDGDYKHINEVISSHNWIYSRPTDDFDAAFKALLQTLDTDLDYVKMHTRLLLRAREWDNKKRNPSFVLRGADLQDAERWHLSSTGKQPAPTQLHHEYIDSSRKVAARRQRATIGLLAAGLVIAIVLALVALRQTQIADQNAAIVEGNYRHTRSQQLGIQAQNILNKEGNRSAELAALLAIQAMKIENTIEAENSLSQALRLMYPVSVLKGHTDVVTSVAITSDEKYVVTGSADKTIRLWDAATGKEIRQFTGHTDKVTGVAVLNAEYNNGVTVIVSSSADGTVRLWDMEKGTEIGQLVGHTGPVTSVHVIDHVIVTTGADKTVRIWDGQDKTQYAVLTGHEDVITSADISPGGRFIASGSLDKTVRLWDVTTGQVIATVHTDDAVTSVALQQDYSGIEIGTDQRAVQFESINLLPPDVVPDLGLGGVSSSTSIAPGEGKGGTSSNSIVAFYPDNNALIYSTGDSAVHDSLGNKFNLTGHADSISSIATSNNLIVTGSYDKTAIIWHIQPTDGIQSWINELQVSSDGKYMLSVGGGYFESGQSQDTEWHPDGNFTALGFSPDSKSILWGDGSGQFELRAVKTNDLISHFDLSKDPAFSSDISGLDSFSADGKLIALTSKFDPGSSTPPRGILINVASGKVLGRIPGKILQFSPDGRYLVTMSDKHHLIKTESMEDVSAMLPAEALTTFRFTPDGKYIAYASGSAATGASLILLDATTIKEVRHLTLAGPQFTFSPDGKSVLDLGNADQPMRLLDFQSGAEVRRFLDPLPYSPTELRQLSFSADGKYLLASSAMEVDVWDVSTGHRLRQFAADGLRPDAQISVDGKSIILHDGIGRTLLVPMDFHDRITYACARLTRDLTDEERLEYGIKDNTPTCGQTSPPK